MESQTNSIFLLVAILGLGLFLILMLSGTIALPLQAAIPSFSKSNFHNSLKIDNKYRELSGTLENLQLILLPVVMKALGKQV